MCYRNFLVLTQMAIVLHALFCVVTDVQAQFDIVKNYQKINKENGNFTGILDNDDNFGVSLTKLGDLDRDGVIDIAVGAPRDDDGGNDTGAVWILFLNSDGTVKRHQKISKESGDFEGVLDEGDHFGTSLTELGDLDGDGTVDIAVGASDDDGGDSENAGVEKSGAVWILFLNPDGTVKTHQKISNTSGNFSGGLGRRDYFGASITNLGDLDGDGKIDLAVGAHQDFSAGAVWILFLNSDGTVQKHQKIDQTEGNFTGIISQGDQFGFSLSSLNDLNQDGIGDLAVGAIQAQDGGAVWILFLNPDGTVKSHQKINRTEGNFQGGLEASDQFGTSIASLGDVNNDGVTDIAVGARNDDRGKVQSGAVWILLLAQDGTVKRHQRLGDDVSIQTDLLEPYDNFGAAVTSLGDLNQDGIIDLGIGAPNDDDGLLNGGAVWVYHLRQSQIPMTISPASLVFGDVPSGQEISKTVTLFNSSDEEISVANIVSPDPQFTISAQSFTIPSGNSLDINITVTPMSKGRIFTNLIFETDSNDLSWNLPVFAFGTFSGTPNGAEEGGIQNLIEDTFTTRFDVKDHISLTGPIEDDEGKNAPGIITHLSTSPIDITLDQIRVLRANYNEVFREMPRNFRLIVEVNRVVINGDSAVVDALYHFIAREGGSHEFIHAAPRMITFKMKKADGRWFITDMESIRAYLAKGLGLEDQPVLARLLPSLTLVVQDTAFFQNNDLVVLGTPFIQNLQENPIFIRSENNSFSLAASTHQESVVRVQVEEDTLKVLPIEAGEATIQIEAIGKYGSIRSINFHVTVIHPDPSVSVDSLNLVQINIPNRAPETSRDIFALETNGRINIIPTYNDSDPDSDPITLVGYEQSTNSYSLVMNQDGSLRYQPHLGFTGVDSFTYTIGDGRDGFKTGTVAVHVIASTDSGKVVTLLGKGIGNASNIPDLNVSSPTHITLDTEGNIYFSTNNHRVFKADPSGYVTTIAGNGNARFAGDGGPAAEASLDTPLGLSIDTNGSLYIADRSNHRIRKVNALGLISTVVGANSGVLGDGGSAENALVSFPSDVFVTSDGYLYITDSGHHRIRRIDPLGTITTVAGNGQRGNAGDGDLATNAMLNNPTGIYVDAMKNIYFVDAGNYTIRKVDASGRITTFAGTGSRGNPSDGVPATESRLRNPQDVYGDISGNIYVSDGSGDRILKIAKDGLIYFFAGTGSTSGQSAGVSAESATIAFPTSLFIDHFNNLFLVASSQILKILSGNPDGFIAVGAPTLPTPDFDHDGHVNFSDFVIFAQAFGTDNALFDLDGDGRVNFRDLILFAQAFEL